MAAASFHVLKHVSAATVFIKGVVSGEALPQDSGKFTVCAGPGCTYASGAEPDGLNRSARHALESACGSACLHTSIASCPKDYSSTTRSSTAVYTSTVAETFSIATDDRATAQAAAAEALALALAAVKAANEAAAIAEFQRAGQKSWSYEHDTVNSPRRVLEHNSVHLERNEDRNIRAGLLRRPKPMDEVRKTSLDDEADIASCSERESPGYVDGREVLSADSFRSRQISSEDLGQGPTSLGRALEKAQSAALAQVADERRKRSPIVPFDELETVKEGGLVKSKRKGERLLRREKALEKSQLQSKMLGEQVFVKSKKTTISSNSSSGDVIREYIATIGKGGKLLTAAEEVELAIGIQVLLELQRVRVEALSVLEREPTRPEWASAAGLELNVFEKQLRYGEDCKEKMVGSNLRLVISVAKNYQGRGVDFHDLVQEGTLGLRKAAEKFDHRKGFKFSTYAHWWIRQAITRCIADQSRIIRLPVHLYEVISKVNKAKRMLTEEYGRPPSDFEVAELVGMPPMKLQGILRAARTPSSMEKPVGDDGDRTVAELVSDPNAENPEDDISQKLLRVDVENMLHTLNPRERDVMRLRFGLEDGRVRTLEEIGHLFRVTRERIRQIETKALRKLRQPSRNSMLKEYVGES
eukprot:jgi/Mesen1/3388/ME000192S02554